VERIAPDRRAGGLHKVRLRLPPEEARTVEILGNGAAAAPRVVEVLRGLGLVAS
jgi:electron transfer flavoprotein beta subunit